MKLLTPYETFALFQRLIDPVRIAVLLVAATGLRISECLALKWSHVDWANHRILIQQTFRRGDIQTRTKTKASNAPVPMCEALARYLKQWRQQTNYSSEGDSLFPSVKLDGRQPLWGQTLNAKFVKPSAVALGLVAPSERFGWHSPQPQHLD